MDFDSWIFTAALVFCIIAMARCDSGSKINCDIIHEGKPMHMCETYK